MLCQAMSAELFVIDPLEYFRILLWVIIVSILLLQGLQRRYRFHLQQRNRFFYRLHLQQRNRLFYRRYRLHRVLLICVLRICYLATA